MSTATDAAPTPFDPGGTSSGVYAPVTYRAPDGAPVVALAARVRRAHDRREAWITLTTEEADALLAACEEDRVSLGRWHREHRARLCGQAVGLEDGTLAEALAPYGPEHDTDACEALDCEACDLLDAAENGWLVGRAITAGVGSVPIVVTVTGDAGACGHDAAERSGGTR